MNLIIDNIIDNALPEQAKPEFHITSDGAADWYLKQLACLDSEMALIRAQADASIKRLQSDKDGLTHLYGAELEAYIGEKIAQDKRGRKSIILPHGTAGFRTVPAALKIADYDAAYKHAFRAFAEEAVWLPPRLSPSGYIEQAQKAIREDGELLPGVERVEARQSFSIKFGKSDEAGE